MTDLLKRRDAVDQVIARFNGQPLIWGRFDCARLAAATAKAMGHRVRLSAFGQYTTPAAAKAALRRKGFEDLPEAIDAMGFERIAPARCLPGDVIGFLPQPDPDDPLPGDDFTTLCIWVGNGRVLGFHAGTGVCCIVQPDYSGAKSPPVAWRL